MSPLSLSHKLISIFYFIFLLFSSIMSMSISLTMSMELSSPSPQFIPFLTYHTLITLHGIIFLFYVVMALLMGTIPNYFIPIMVNTNDVSFPSMNNISFWMLPPSMLLYISSMFLSTGPSYGWTFYPPLSTSSSSILLGLSIFSIHLASISSILSSLNILILIISSPSHSYSLYTHSIIILSILTILFIPVLSASILMLLTDSLISTSFFHPSLGGNPILYQHIFWIFGHPEVYILIIPAFGMISTSISSSSSSPIYSPLGMTMAMYSISTIGSIVWAHHMYTLSMDLPSLHFFMTSLMIISIPTGIKVFTWLTSIYTSSTPTTTPSLFTISFILFFTMGGITGIILSSPTLDLIMHDSYYVVSHFHYTLSISSIMSIFSLFYTYHPLILSSPLTPTSLTYSISHFTLFFISLNILFMTLHIPGMTGMPSSIISYPSIYTSYNYISSMSLVLSLISLIFFISYITSHVKLA